VWQANDLDEESTEAHLSALVTGHSYLMAGPGESYPRVTIEYPDDVAVEVDPATRRVVAALKVWSENDKIDNRGTLFLPGRVVDFEWATSLGGSRPEWLPDMTHHQTSPLVPVVPMHNRPRKGCGRSDLTALRPVVDAANQIATNMLAAVEHHALPRKYAIGVSEKDFVGRDGEPLPAWKIATGAVWAVQGRIPQRGEQAPQIELGQFPASDLRNFIETMKEMSTLAASLYGLPPHFMGYASDNPASADAIRSSESRLIKRAERRQTSFGGSWEKIMRIAWAMLGEDPDTASRLETIWRDPATPTRAAKVDAAVKAFQAGMIDAEQAREDSGYTVEQRARMRSRDGDLAAQALRGVRTMDLPGVTGDPAFAG
jgi:hypothetical protein